MEKLARISVFFVALCAGCLGVTAEANELLRATVRTSNGSFVFKDDSADIEAGVPSVIHTHTRPHSRKVALSLPNSISEVLIILGELDGMLLLPRHGGGRTPAKYAPDRRHELSLVEDWSGIHVTRFGLPFYFYRVRIHPSLGPFSLAKERRFHEIRASGSSGLMRYTPTVTDGMMPQYFGLEMGVSSVGPDHLIRRSLVAVAAFPGPGGLTYVVPISEMRKGNLYLFPVPTMALHIADDDAEYSQWLETEVDDDVVMVLNRGTFPVTDLVRMSHAFSPVKTLPLTTSRWTKKEMAEFVSEAVKDSDFALSVEKLQKFLNQNEKTPVMKRFFSGCVSSVLRALRLAEPRPAPVYFEEAY